VNRRSTTVSAARQNAPDGDGGRAPDQSRVPPSGPLARFRVLVTGSRTWTDRTTIRAALDRVRAEVAERGLEPVIVHGACPRGADAIADQWCQDTGVRVERWPADWRNGGRGAGMMRNAEMVASRPAMCLAFIRDNSPGASQCAALADLTGIPVRRHRHRGGDPATTATTATPQVTPMIECCGVADRSATTATRARSDRARLDAALDYAAAGWPVFLLGRSKRPLPNCQACHRAESGHDRTACRCLLCHGFYAATTDPDRIRAMHAAAPDGLLALRTGTASGLVVVDIDPRNDGQVAPDLMPPTAAVRTGSAGWHLYYRHPGTPLTSRPLAGHTGVDIKADGGYVVLPPSRHPTTKRPYRWIGARPIAEMPRALVDACSPDPATPANAAVRSDTAANDGAVPLGEPPNRPQPALRRARGISSPAALLEAHLESVRNASKGTRRHTLYGAARGVARMILTEVLTVESGVAELTAVGRAAEQTDRDIRAAIRGGFRDEGLSL
jgi:hypothetical protein